MSFTYSACSAICILNIIWVDLTGGMHGNPRSYARTLRIVYRPTYYLLPVCPFITSARCTSHDILLANLIFNSFTILSWLNLFWKLEKGSAISINCYCSAYLPTYLVLFMSVNHALSSQQLLQCQYCAKMKHRIIIVNTICTPIQGVSGWWQFP